MEGLEGAAQTIRRSHPIMLIESIKTDREQLQQWLERQGYTITKAGINVLAIHQSDKTLGDLKPQ